MLNSDHEKMYQLVFEEEYNRGGWFPHLFFSEQGTINFTLYPSDEREKHRIEGGSLTTEFYTYPYSEKKLGESQSQLYDEYNRLIDENKWHSPEALCLLEKAEAATTDEGKRLLWDEFYKMEESKKYTPEIQEIHNELKRTTKIWQDKQLQYAKEYVGIVGFNILVIQMEDADDDRYVIDTALVKEIFNTIYAPKYPNHPYTEKMKLLMNKVRVGERFIDFEAPDLNGNNVKLSEQIQGKLSVIHLWASWCGPCLRKGRELTPIYEAYKSKGFTVVGVARERNNTNAMKAAIERHKYPWLNLVELHDSANIWVKYGLGNSGGGDFLVDENGVILIINPTAEEVKKILKERLK